MSTFFSQIDGEKQKSDQERATVTNRNSNARYEVRSLVRGLRVLETLEGVGKALRLTDLAQELGIERATLFRYCATLTRHGYLHIEPSTKMYSLGPRIRSLGYAAQEQWAWLDEVRSHLSQISGRFRGAASFAIRDGTEIIYIERAVAGGALNHQIELGDRLPVWMTSIGKALLADLEDEAVRELLSEEVPDADVDLLMSELAEIRDTGVAFNINVNNSGLNSVAVPLRASELAPPVGGINLAGNAAALSLAILRSEVGPVLQQVAASIAVPGAIKA
jgi:IclR family transcriptional regulator, pca regulon regulatory protein